MRTILFSSASEALGINPVSTIRAGATPLTVMPFLAYAEASQWTKPWRADFEDLDIGRMSV